MEAYWEHRHLTFVTYFHCYTFTQIITFIHYHDIRYLLPLLHVHPEYHLYSLPWHSLSENSCTVLTSLQRAALLMPTTQEHSLVFVVLPIIWVKVNIKIITIEQSKAMLLLHDKNHNRKWKQYKYTSSPSKASCMYASNNVMFKYVYIRFQLYVHNNLKLTSTTYYMVYTIEQESMPRVQNDLDCNPNRRCIQLFLSNT